MEPNLDSPTWQRATHAQCKSDVFADWAKRLGILAAPHRKLWEYVYISRCLELAGVLQPGRKGLGFGVGREPLVRVYAAMGCELLATDYPAPGWKGVTTAALEDLGVASEDSDRVQFNFVDMRKVPSQLYNSFDFTWSSCALEHLGGLKPGWDFVRHSLHCLKPGGVAVHTTELCVNSDRKTLDRGATVLYRQRDVRMLIAELVGAGYDCTYLNFAGGVDEGDAVVNVNGGDPWHINVRVDRTPFVTTSFGMVIRRPA